MWTPSPDARQCSNLFAMKTKGFTKKSMTAPIAVLCAARNSIYKTMEGVDVYDLDRDAKTFFGSVPIVGHPPCRSWSAFCAHQAKPLPGEKELGPLVVWMLRNNGGVLEHPAHSRLWDGH